MGRDRSRVLGLAIGYLVAVVPALFLDWFYLDLGIASVHVDLRSGGTLAAICFWGSILLMFPAVGFQTFTRVTSGVANAKLSRYGVLAGLSLIGAGVLAAYIFAPELPGPSELMPEMQRTVAPLLFLAGTALGVAAVHFAAVETTDDNAGTYIPVKIERPATVPPINKPITQPPIAQAPVSRPATVPPATRPITQPPVSVPASKPKLSYVVMSGEVTRAGIDARRQDGSSLLVLWRDVVGVVVRRLPDELEATTFMDIVSVKGSTLRIVPWTRLTGISVAGTGDDRVRSLAGYVAAMCGDVQLFDPATKNFLDNSQPAAQLKDVAKLNAHDERLS